MEAFPGGWQPWLCCRSMLRLQAVAPAFSCSMCHFVVGPPRNVFDRLSRPLKAFRGQAHVWLRYISISFCWIASGAELPDSGSHHREQTKE